MRRHLRPENLGSRRYPILPSTDRLDDASTAAGKSANARQSRSDSIKMQAWIQIAFDLAPLRIGPVNGCLLSVRIRTVKFLSNR